MIKSIKTKLKFTALAALIVTLICCVFIAFAGVGQRSKTANATATGTSYALGANGAINKSGVEGLMGQIAGKSTATYEELKTYMDAQTDKVKTGSAIDAQVILGGETWNVVYASETRTGEVIATLWLASSSDVQQFNNWDSEDSHGWSFPSNMYSSSFVRSYLNGTLYASSSTAGSITDRTLVNLCSRAQATEAQSTAWASFLNDYGNYIVAPTEVAYQETECVATGSSTKPNEAYGTPAQQNWYYDYMNYSSKPGYGNWQYDKLWLPSYTEVGTGSDTTPSGLWEITGTVRANASNSWTRSANRGFADLASFIKADGTNDNGNATDTNAVRPALHLNLAKISAELAEEKDTSVATAWNNAVEESLQTGEQVTFTLEKDWYAMPNGEGTSFGEGTGFTGGTIFIPAAASIKLDLNGHKIDRNLKTMINGADGCNIFVYGELELCDNSADGAGIITGGYTSGGGVRLNGSKTINRSAKLVMSGGKITGNIAQNGGGGVSVNGGTFIMNGGEISGNGSTGGTGNVYLNDTTFTMEGGKVTGSDFGGLVAFGCSVTMNGGEVSDNRVDGNSGGIGIDDKTTFIMNNGKFTSNAARGLGGALGLSGSFTMNGGSLVGNHSSGGAIYSQGYEIFMNGGEISGNYSRGNGGGISFNDKVKMIMTGGTITENVAGASGGGISLNGILEMTGGEISNNTAGTPTHMDGGGLYISGANAKFTLHDGEISGNYAGNAGGGVGCYNSATFTMEGGKIINNTTEGVGGGIEVYNKGVFEMNGGEISGNSTKNSGGGVFYDSETTFIMNGGEISGNSTSSTTNGYGGGIGLNSGATMIMEGGEISGNTTANSGGGVACFGSSIFTMNGGAISGNTSTSSATGGGGVYVSDSCSFTLNYGVISGNEVPKYSGGGVLTRGTFIMNDGVISGNSATGGSGGSTGTPGVGGGVYISELGTTATFTMNGGTISENGANAYGAGVYVGGTFNLGGGVITGNIWDNKGNNNVYLPSGKTVTVTGVFTFVGKNATRVGISNIAHNQYFTTGYGTSGNNTNDGSKFFFSDDNRAVVGGSGELYMYATATMNTLQWQYTANGGTAVNVSGSYFSIDFTGDSYSVVLASGTIQYATNENGETVKNFSKVGKYYFTAANAQNYYNPNFTFEILPQSIESASISVTSTYVYNGEEIIPELSVTLGGLHLTEGVDFTASYLGNVNAGTANIVILGMGDYKGSARGTFTIAKRNLDIRWGDTEAEYSGGSKSVKALAEGLLDGDTVKIFLTYSQNGKEVAPVNAGEYTVTAAIASDNYVLAPNASVTAKLTVKPKHIVAVWSGANYVYSGEEQAPAASYTDAYGRVISLDVTVDGSPVDAGEYTATATAAQADANYILENLTYKFKIVKAAAEISWSGDSFTFDGSDKTPAAAVTGNGEDLSASVNLAYFKGGVQLDGAPVNAGNYVVKATLTHDNYELAASEYSFTIGAANMTVNSVYEDTAFTGEGKAPEITATLNSDELDIKVTYAVAGTDNFTEELPVNAGSYVAKVAEVNGNFNEETVPFAITKADIAVVWSLDGLSVKAVTDNKTTYQWLYDGKAHAPVATLTFGDVEIGLTVNGISAIGTYTVTAVYENNDYNNNFNIANTTANVEIVRSAISEVRWYENGASEPLAAGETPSYKYIEVYGENGPKLSAYGAATLTGVDDAGAEITVTALIPMNVTYSEFVRNGFWAAREEAYNANASLSSAYAPHCDMRATDTSIKFFVTDLTEDEESADVRWVVEVDGAFVAVEDYEFIYNGNVQSPKAIVVLDAEKFEADPTDLTSFAYLPVGGERADAGTYYAYILPCRYLISGDDAECRYTIKPLDVTVTWQVGEYTYNGTAQAPAARVAGTGGLQCNVTVAGFVNAGTHVATAVVDKNFNIVSGATQEFTIEKLTLAADRIEWNCDEDGAKREEDFFVWNYDGELHLPTATMKVRINGENVDVTLAVTGSASSVGTHYAFAILANTDKNNSNFAFAGARARFDIVLDTISHIYWSDEDAQGKINYTYDGEAHLPTAYYMNGDVRVDLTVIGERTEAGTYIAYVTDNFDFAVSTRHEFTILPQPLNVAWSRVEVDYTGAEQRPVVRFTDEEGETVYLSAEEYAVTGFIGAGEYTAEIFSLNGNYTFVNSTNDYTIKAINVTLTWLGNDDGTFAWEYDGEKHVPSVSPVTGVTVTVIGGESGVGEYTAVAVCDNENYVIINATQVFEIKPFEITVNWTVGEYTYDGESYFKPTATYVDMNGDEQELIVNGARVDAGEYTAEAVLPENCAFKYESGENAGTHGFTINRLLLTEISWTGNEDGSFVWEYDGETHSPVATAGTVKIAITGGAVNAGKYVAKAEPANVENYAFAEGVEVEQSFEITPKTVDVKWYGENDSEDDDFVWEYDGTLRAPTAKFEGAEGLVSVPVNGATANSGEHQATAIDVFNNYEFSKLTSTQRFHINGKEVTAVWVAGDNGTYNETDKVYEYVFNGKAQQPTASAEGVQFAYTIKNAAGDVVSAAISAGEYTVTVTATNKNFTVSAESETVKVSVKAKKVTVQWGNLTLDYTGAAQVPEAWFTDANNQLVKLEVSGEKTETGEDYEVTASFKNATGNYELEGDVTNTFSIVKASADEVYWDWATDEWKIKTTEPAEPIPDPETPDGN